MRLIGDLLGEVLANTAKLVAERKVCGMNTLTGHEVTPYGVPVRPEVFVLVGPEARSPRAKVALRE